MAFTTIPYNRCSGHRSLQIINEVKCVVRELVENSLDAGATEIDIRLVDSGFTMIQVTDNGRGILRENFEILAKRSTTSKIQCFDDIFSSLNTFGFRGEALNSIADVSKLEVETRRVGEDVGWILIFDAEGTLLEKRQLATKVGTTVRCSNLFESYPVRRNMLIKSSKSQASATVLLLQQYSIINPRVRFSLTNRSSSSQKTTNMFVSSGKCESIREVAEDIFGKNIIKHTTDVNIQTEYLSLEGIISLPSYGRQGKDIQFLFVNGRPVDEMNKIRKCIKEVYRQFSSKVNLAYILNFATDVHNIDINVVPDKRRVFLLSEDLTVQQLKNELFRLYMSRTSKNLSQMDSIEMQSTPCNEDLNALESSRIYHESFVWDPSKEENMIVGRDDRCYDDASKDIYEDETYDTVTEPCVIYPDITPKPKNDTSIWKSFGQSSEFAPSGESVKNTDDKKGDPATEITQSYTVNSNFQESQIIGESITTHNGYKTAWKSGSTGTEFSENVYTDIACNENLEFLFGSEIPGGDGDWVGETIKVDFERLYNEQIHVNTYPIKHNVEWNQGIKDLSLTDHDKLDPKAFLDMRVCGQFNNGFIIAKLERSETHTGGAYYSIYIIDQHAADEKAKFEAYNELLKIKKQPLVCSRRIDLSPFHQKVVEDNLEILEENGFETFVLREPEDEKFAPGVYLASFPQFLGHILGEEDFVSFVHDLARTGNRHKDSQKENLSMSQIIWGNCLILPRPGKIWNILATRACKRAIKIGDPLPYKKMENIKNALAGLMHPWNCPHGRPTVRCLISGKQLKLIAKSETHFKDKT